MAKVKSINNTVTQPTFEDIKSWYEQHLAPATIDFDDQKPYEVYAQGRFAGVFQCTGNGAQRLFMKAKPKSIVDIAALTSIYRPGPLAAKVDKLWLEHADTPYDWGHPLINDVLKETRGCLAGETEVLTSEGLIKIEDIVNDNHVGMQLLSYNESSGTLEQDVVEAVANTGVQNTIEIDTDTGTLILTEDHPVLTDKGWKQAGDLTLTDKIVCVTTDKIKNQYGIK